VKAFRAAAEQENGDRRRLRRRYSPALRGQAVRYWRARQVAGATVREVAVALGVAPWSLYRWTRAAPTRGRFHAVQVVATESPAVHASLVIVVSAGHTRVEGLDVESAARLLTLLR
jgi:transposase-like protein